LHATATPLGARPSAGCFAARCAAALPLKGRLDSRRISRKTANCAKTLTSKPERLKTAVRRRNAHMAAITLIDNYDSFTWNLVHCLGSLARM